MIGVARDAGIGDIEFENEPVLPARRIVREHLPKARAGGAHTVLDGAQKRRTRVKGSPKD